MLAQISIPVAASVSPSDSIISRWPSAVAPLWEPMQGTRNGSAPFARSQSPAAFVIRAMLSIPRLPAVIATLPRGGLNPRLSSCRRTSASMSASGLETSF